jgi:chitinase
MKKNIWTNLFSVLLVSIPYINAEASLMSELFSGTQLAAGLCGTKVLPIQISMTSPSTDVLSTTITGYNQTSCAGTINYSNTWSTPTPGATIYPQSYSLCTNALLSPGYSFCSADLKSMSFQMLDSTGYKSPQGCQNVTCSGGVFTPSGTAWSNQISQSSGRMIGYLYGWQTPPTALSIAQAGYTHVLIAFGLFSTTSPGTINLQAVSGFDLATYVQDLHANGLKVLLSIGGASTSIPNTTVDFDGAVALATNPSTFETTFVNNMLSLVSTYGFDGFDFDIESGLNAASSFSNPSLNCSNATYNSTCDIYYLTTIINNFHAQSPASMITLVPQIANMAATASFSSVWGNYASLIMQVRPALTWVSFQNYNSGCAYGINGVCYPTTGTTLTSSSDSAVAFATDLLENWPTPQFNPYLSFLSPSQVVIGYVVQNASGGSDGSPYAIPSVTKNVITCLRSHQNCDTYTPPAVYPGIGGVFAWSINYDANNSYQFANSLSACVVNGVCT